MARYDGLIIPRSYNEYISKSDAATLSQALKLGGALNSALGAAGAQQTLTDLSEFVLSSNKKATAATIATFANEKIKKYQNLYVGMDTTSTDVGFYDLLTINRVNAYVSQDLTLLVTPANNNNRELKPAIVQISFRFGQFIAIQPYAFLLSNKNVEILNRLIIAYSTTEEVPSKLYIKEESAAYDPIKINILDFTSRGKSKIENVVTINESLTLLESIPEIYETISVYDLLNNNAVV